MHTLRVVKLLIMKQERLVITKFENDRKVRSSKLLTKPDHLRRGVNPFSTWFLHVV